jgi:hypothetical protein
MRVARVRSRLRIVGCTLKTFIWTDSEKLGKTFNQDSEPPGRVPNRELLYAKLKDLASK